MTTNEQNSPTQLGLKVTVDAHVHDYATSGTPGRYDGIQRETRLPGLLKTTHSALPVKI